MCPKSTFMKFIFILIFLLPIQTKVLAQKIDFCQMLKADQSNTCLGIDFNSDSCIAQKMRRIQTYETNFKVLLQITRASGFPNNQNHPHDSCVNDLSIVTFIHISQSKPELIFNGEIIDLFDEEIKKGNLKKQYLYPMFIGYAKYSQPKEKDKVMVEKAIKKWDLENELKQIIDIKYSPEP
jgi:hypothetical protein